MNCWAVIPVKSFAHGKSRLATILGAKQREALNRRLFGRVIEAARSAVRADRIAVVAGDTLLLTLVQAQGMHGLPDPGGGLNVALAFGCRYAIERGAGAVIVLPSDLPMITADDVASVAAALGDHACVIAPDEQEQGTNALGIAPPDAGFFRFGAGSFQAHLSAARAQGMRIHILRRPGLALDLDTPESYRRFAKGELAPSGALA